MKNIILLIAFIGFGLSQIKSQEINWSSILQGLEGGIFYTITASDNYILASNGYSVFKTNDGENWSELTHEYFGFYDIKTDKNRFYFLTRDYQVLYGNDNLSSFTEIDVPNNFRVNNLAVGDGKIFCTDRWWSQSGIIYFSSNNGSTWEENKAPITGEITYNSGTLFIHNYNNGLFYSNDNGKTFNKIQINSKKISNYSVNDKFIYAISNYEAFYSEDLGKTWNQFTRENLKLTYEQSVSRIKSYNKFLVVTSYTNEYSISVDYGKTWVARNQSDQSIDYMNPIIFLNSYYLTVADWANNGGFYKYDLLNSSLIEKNNELYLNQFYYSYSDGKNLYIQDNASNIYLLKENEQTWKKIIKYSNSIIIDDSGIYILDFNKKSILKSINQGTSFSSYNANFSKTYYSINGKPLKYDSRIYFAEKDTIYSIDIDGKNFQVKNNGIISDGAPIYLRGGKNALFAKQSKKLFLYNKNENTWKDISSNFELSSEYFEIVEFENDIYFFESNKGTFVSKDNGISFVKINNNSYDISSFIKMGDYFIGVRKGSGYLLASKDNWVSFNDIELILNNKNYGTYHDQYFWNLASSNNRSLLMTTNSVYISTDKPKIPEYDANGRKQDSLALVALYNATGGITWNRQDNWLTNKPLEAWYGVYLDESGRVNILMLNYNNLISTIPKELGNMSNLQRLQLVENQLTGNIPSELGKLTNLKELFISRNQLEGTIPKELGNLSNLEYLNLSDNLLTGNIPAEIGNLINLRVLNLTRNKINGSIPQTLSNLTNLESLGLGGNGNITGSIPKELGKLTSLKELYLWRNQLEGTIPKELGNLSKLENLQISNNQLTGNIPTEIGNMINLKDFRLTRNKISGTMPQTLSQLYNLEVLAFGGNELNGTIPTWLGNLTALKELYLWGNQLTGTIPKELGNLSNLESLQISNNQLTGNIPTWLGNLTALKELYLWGNQITGSIPKELGNLEQLERLYLNDMPLTGTLPKEIGNLKKLKELYLRFTEITGPLPIEIGNLEVLELLNIRNSNIGGSLPSTFRNLKALKELYISDCRFDGGLENIPSHKLDSIWAYGNKFDFVDFAKANINAIAFRYSPQDSLGKEEEIKLTEGEKLTISSETEHIAGNVYRWYKNGVLIPNRTSQELIIESAKIEDTGVYTCEVNNPIAPELTLFRNYVKVFVESSSSVNENQQYQIKLYPNPTFGIIKIKIEEIVGPLKIEIRDINGKLMFENYCVDYIYDIDISNFETGTYYITMTNDRNIYTKTFIKVK